MHTYAIALAVVLSTPLLSSVILNAWAAIWHPSSPGPLSRRQHRALLGAEAAVTLALLFQLGGLAAYVAAAALYLSLGIGAAVLLHQRGAVPCGCWGGGRGRLSRRLVGFDLALAGLATLAALLQDGAEADPALSGAILASLGLLIFVAAVAVPDLRHAWRGVRPRALQEYRWYHNFPDLEDA